MKTINKQDYPVSAGKLPLRTRLSISLFALLLTAVTTLLLPTLNSTLNASRPESIVTVREVNTIQQKNPQKTQAQPLPPTKSTLPPSPPQPTPVPIATNLASPVPQMPTAEFKPSLPSPDYSLNFSLNHEPSISEPESPVSTKLFQPDTQPIPKHTPAPLYPFNARRKGIQGKVTVEFTVNPNGIPEDIVIIEDNSSGNVFTERVKQTIADWRFTPATKDGVPVSSRMRTPLTFSLEK